MVTLAANVPIAWSSRPQTSVFGSITEAELTSALHTIRTLRCLGTMTTELHIPLSNPSTRTPSGNPASVVTFCVDNKGAVDIVQKSGPTKLSHHMGFQSMLDQEQVGRWILRICQVSKARQLTDYMTNRLVPTALRRALLAVGIDRLSRRACDSSQYSFLGTTGRASDRSHVIQL